MPFLRAGFNARSRDTGIRAWTRHVEGRKFAPAELRQFSAGDYFWLDVEKSPRFLSWGEQVVIGTWREFDLADEYQFGLPMSKLEDCQPPAPARVKLVLPYPVSANRYWISFWSPRQKRVFTGPTKEAKAYKEEIGWRAKAAGVRAPIAGLVELRVRLVPESGVCMDLDNSLKVAIDAMKDIVFGDDSQVYRIVAERAEADPAGGKRLEVEVVPYTMPMALEGAA